MYGTTYCPNCGVTLAYGQSNTHTCENGQVMEYETKKFHVELDKLETQMKSWENNHTKYYRWKLEHKR